MAITRLLIASIHLKYFTINVIQGSQEVDLCSSLTAHKIPLLKTKNPKKHRAMFPLASGHLVKQSDCACAFKFNYDSLRNPGVEFKALLLGLIIDSGLNCVLLDH